MGMYVTFSTLWKVTIGFHVMSSSPISSNPGRSCGSACQHRVASWINGLNAFSANLGRKSCLTTAVMTSTASMPENGDSPCAAISHSNTAKE